MALLEVRDLTVEYATPAGTVHAASNVSLDLSAGELLGVVGESGSGKTTVILGILRLVPVPGRVVGGSVSLGGEDLLAESRAAMRQRRGKDLAYVPQAALNSLNPVMRVGTQIEEALALHTDLSGKAAAARVWEVLEMVELDRDVARRYPHELSGGMRQRAVIAMALAPGPKVLLADEPTSGLDVLVRGQVLALLRRLVNDLGLALLLVSHDLHLVSRWCNRAMVMYAGRVVEECPSSDLLDGGLHPYTAALSRSLLHVDGPLEGTSPIGGEVPDLAHLPAGCAFHPRCPKAMPMCAEHLPALVKVGDHAVACHLYGDDDG